MELLILTGRKFTALYPQTQRKVEILDIYICDRIQKWAMFSAINELEIEDFFNKKIWYKGIKYKGSPEQVYWQYFQPFFDHEMPRVLSEVENDCLKKNLKPDEYVQEAAELLKVMVSRLWNEIAKTDQKLKGAGFPKKEDLKDVSGIIKFYRKKIDDELKAVLYRVDVLVEENEQNKEDIIEVKPNFMGIGLNLNAAFRWFKNLRKNM